MTFTIITVVYNEAYDLEKTISSLKKQSFKGYQYIVIDGGSYDGSTEIIKDNKSFIDCYVSESDAGIYDAMNKGIKLAKCEYILFLNAGDVFSSTDVLQQISKNINSSDKIVYGDNTVINSKGVKKYLSSKKFNKPNLLFWGTRTVCHQAFIVKRDVILNYDLKYQLKAELDWYFRLLKKVKRDQIKKVDFSIVDYQLGGIGERKIKQNVKEQIQVCLKHSGLGFLLGLPVMIYKFINTSLRI